MRRELVVGAVLLSALVPGTLVFGSLLAAVPAEAQPAPPGAGGRGGPAGPVQVGVVTLKAQAVPITVELPGRVTASASADVRPQVGGIIKSVDFRAGQQVKAGDNLYEIDDASYQAEVAAQAAAVQKAEAAVSTAQSTVNRNEKLAASNNISASDLEAAQATLAQAKADVASAEASLKTAQINLGFTKVTAPISGIISDSSVNAGALVTAAQTTALATVRQLDPVYINVVETATNLLRVRSQLESGTLKSSTAGPTPTITFHLALEDGSTYPQVGQMTFLDVAVSESTGTFLAQGTVPNPNRLLLPGMFVRATLDLGSAPSAFLVPQRAVTFDASGNATAFVAENGKAVSHKVTTNGNSGNYWVVTAGLNDGAQVIVDGLQKIHDGSDIQPLPVTLDADGVVVEPAGSSAKPAAPASTAGH